MLMLICLRYAQLSIYFLVLFFITALLANATALQDLSVSDFLQNTCKIT